MWELSKKSGGLDSLAVVQTALDPSLSLLSLSLLAPLSTCSPLSCSFGPCMCACSSLVPVPCWLLALAWPSGGCYDYVGK